MKNHTYPPVTTVSGANVVHQAAGRFHLEPSPDGLEFVVDPPLFNHKIAIPQRLFSFLLDLRLLRRVPIAYLVPDADLLPPESIRFFNVDLTWIERVIDGVWSVGNTDSLGSMTMTSLLPLVRQELDAAMVAMVAEQGGKNWSPDGPMTGLLIRSELVRRWPDMIVTAFDLSAARPVGVLRAEPISRDLFIALFAGRPNEVHLREPRVGARFGVELKDEGGPFVVDPRAANGEAVKGDPIVIPRREPKSTRVIDVKGFASNVHIKDQPRMVALHLEQRAYVQEFKDAGVPESRGSVRPEAFEGLTVTFGRGRFTMDLTDLSDRLQRQTERGGT